MSPLRSPSSAARQPTRPSISPPSSLRQVQLARARDPRVPLEPVWRPGARLGGRDCRLLRQEPRRLVPAHGQERRQWRGEWLCCMGLGWSGLGLGNRLASGRIGGAGFADVGWLSREAADDVLVQERGDFYSTVCFTRWLGIMVVRSDVDRWGARRASPRGRRRARKGMTVFPIVEDATDSRLDSASLAYFVAPVCRGPSWGVRRT